MIPEGFCVVANNGTTARPVYGVTVPLTAETAQQYARLSTEAARRVGKDTVEYTVFHR